jgi:hypothetical protein
MLARTSDCSLSTRVFQLPRRYVLGQVRGPRRLEAFRGPRNLADDSRRRRRTRHTARQARDVRPQGLCLGVCATKAYARKSRTSVPSLANLVTGPPDWQGQIWGRVAKALRQPPQPPGRPARMVSSPTRSGDNPPTATTTMSDTDRERDLFGRYRPDSTAMRHAESHHDTSVAQVARKALLP